MGLDHCASYVRGNCRNAQQMQAVKAVDDEELHPCRQRHAMRKRSTAAAKRADARAQPRGSTCDDAGKQQRECHLKDDPQAFAGAIFRKRATLDVALRVFSFVTTISSKGVHRGSDAAPGGLVLHVHQVTGHS